MKMQVISVFLVGVFGQFFGCVFQGQKIQKYAKLVRSASVGEMRYVGNFERRPYLVKGLLENHELTKSKYAKIKAFCKRINSLGAVVCKFKEFANTTSVFPRGNHSDIDSARSKAIWWKGVGFSEQEADMLIDAYEIVKVIQRTFVSADKNFENMEEWNDELEAHEAWMKLRLLYCKQEKFSDAIINAVMLAGIDIAQSKFLIMMKAQRVLEDYVKEFFPRILDLAEDIKPILSRVKK